MDYSKLAAQFGGAAVEPQQEQPIDYAALAAQFGGTAQQEKPTDYAALAAQFGGTTVNAPAPTESGGFFGSMGTALKERAVTALPSAKIYTGLGDQKAATDELLKHKQDSQNAYKQTEFSDIGESFKQGQFTEALGKTVDKFKEVAGSSFGSMAPAMVAGAAAAAAAPVALPAAAVGTAAFGLVALGSYIADNLGRQKEEQEAKGKRYEDVNRLDATIAAAGQTALDVFGFKFFKPLGALVGIEGKAAADKAAMEIVESATRPNAYKRAVARGTATGIAFEVPQEVTQSVLERWQAGLAVNPFTDPSAAKEYMEAAGGAMMLGGPMGAYSGAAQTFKARRSDEGKALLEETKNGSLYERLGKGEEDAGKAVSIPDRTSDGLVVQPSAESSLTGETSQPDAGGVVSTGRDDGAVDGGERVLPSALTPPTTGTFDEFRESYNDIRSRLDAMPATLKGGQMDMKMRLIADLKELVGEYEPDLSSRLNGKEINDLKNPNSSRVEGILDKVGQSIVRPRAMQGDMFGSLKGATRREQGAAALSGPDAGAQINQLNASRDSIQKDYDSGKFDAVWAMRLANQFGFTRGQAAQNPDAVAQAYMKKAFADIEQAISEVQRKSRGMQGDMFTNMPPAEPKTDPLLDYLDKRDALMAKLDEVQQQGNDLLDEQEKLRDKGILEGKGGSEYLDEINEAEKQRQAKNAEFDETLAQIDALDAERAKTRQEKPAAEAAPEEGGAKPVKKKTRMEFDPVSNKMVEVEEETATDVNRAEETQSGQLIRGFFDAVKVDSESKGQADRHVNSKNTAADALLEYDILEPGQQTTQGLEIALDFLASKLGGVENMAAMVERLGNSTPGQQSAIFSKYNLPDLTTTRGMDSFSKQAQKYLEGIHQRGEGVKITPRRSTPSFVTGQFKGIMPNETRTKVIEEQTKERQANQETGKPRRPESVYKEREFVVQEPKLVSAVRDLFQTLSSVKSRYITPQMIAAKTYLNNGNRESFIDALNALAFDLAYAEKDKARYGKIRDYGAGWQYAGEGGQFAQQFKEWIESNLSKNTTDVLSDMVDHYKKNYDAEVARPAAIEKFQRENDRYRAALSQVRKADKKSGKKTVTSERMSKLYETERQDIEQDYFDNLPTRGLLHEMHPDIKRLLREGDTRGVLEIMAASPKGNKYYAALAQRLLDAGITAETKVIGPDTLTSLSNSAQIEETFGNYLEALEDTVLSVFPEKEHADLINGLRSNNVTKIGRTLMAMQEGVKASSNKSQVEMLNKASTMFVDEFNWNGKYDPNTDTIYVREGAGKLTNHLFLHEAIHAAASILIDNGQNLTGIQKVGYDRLVELFEHSKKQLAHVDLSEAEQYALTDLHEFVSESLTNPDFQAKLRAIEYVGTPLSLWNQFTSAITKLFGVSPKDTESNVMVEVMRATDTMLTDPASTADLSFVSTPKASRAARLKVVPPGLRNEPSTIERLMTANSWSDVKDEIPYLMTSAKAGARPALLGALTLRQIDDLVRGRIPQVNNFIKVTEDFLSRKNRILRESGDIAKNWERLQAAKPEMSRQLGKVMHMATIKGVDPDQASSFQKNNEVELMQNWNQLTPAAKQIYREVRDFYDKRYSEYKTVMNRRVIQMRQLGVSETTITEIRNEFEKGRRKGPYFPLMRHGRFWYQIGSGATKEYYMFESAGQKERHIQERIKRSPELESTIKEGSQYSEQMNTHAKESAFLKTVFDAVDSATFAGGAAEKQDMKDAMYQNFLSNQPESSFRQQFMHRNNVAGYSEDALRNFSASSFHMAYQLARFEHAPDLFSNVEAARVQLKDRMDANQQGFDPKLSQENNELSDYVAEMNERMKLMLNPTDTGTIPSLLSNIGFIWYLTAPASAIVNVLGGMMIGLPTLVGQYVRANPDMSYASAVLKSLGQMKSVASQIISTGFNVETGTRIRDNRLNFPTLDRATNLSATDREAYDRFVADGLIDITAAYDQSGLAAAPTESYLGVRHRAMEALTSLFHNAERFNREIMAMSSFRAAMDKRKDYKDQTLAMEESISEAKDVTNRSMFDYSVANKPRYFQHPVARVILQFKQFPQQMTFFLAHNMYNMFKGASPEVRREARARFVGTMGMAAIFSGGTGVWGFSTVASIINAVYNGMADEDEEEEPFDFELEFVNWAVETFGKNMGTLLTRGVGNAAGIDLASRVKLDDMWFRDSRKNQDEVEALQTFLVDLLGPSVGLVINVAEAAKLYNEGHADRALEMISPAFIKNPLVAMRYANEGVNTLRGDPLIEEVGPFDLLMQSLGIRSSELAEIQYYNITVKGQEQEILKKRQSLLDLYAISIISNDSDALDTAFENIDKFNTKHPSVFIPAESLTKSIEGRFKKSSQTDHGLYVDPKLMGVLGNHTYLD